VCSTSISQETSNGKEKKDQYSDKDFWDKRYELDTTSTYEWYVSFDAIRDRLVTDLRKCESQVRMRNPPYEVMIAGCGNSTFCEDLWREGFQHICGMGQHTYLIN
jgi:hypothetical protein